MSETTTATAEQLNTDEREIRNLLARLGHLADYGDLDVYLTLFTDDAIWEREGDRRQGHTDILSGAKERRASGLQGPGTHSRHMNTTMWVAVDGSDTAEAHSYFLFIQHTDATPTVSMVGHYHDTLRRTSDGWKLAHRRIISEDA
jgi:3-phenylpropionate/cinnamic acid dioxygenase small subunit